MTDYVLELLKHTVNTCGWVCILDGVLSANLRGNKNSPTQFKGFVATQIIVGIILASI